VFFYDPAVPQYCGMTGVQQFRITINNILAGEKILTTKKTER